MKKSIFMKGIDLILPPRCIVSGTVVEAQGTLSAEAWQGLRFIAAPFCGSCGVPFPYDSAVSGGDARCAACLSDPPPFASARSALVYDDASRDIILKLKHADHLQAVPTLVPMLMRAGGDMVAGCDVIVPVPLHRWRLLRRRFNQSAMLALGLSRASGQDCVLDMLTRTRATPPQGHKRARDRASNVRKAFAMTPRHNVQGKTVLLVDDVFTTGSTLRECANVLLAAGARAVHVLTIARAVKE